MILAFRIWLKMLDSKLKQLLLIFTLKLEIQISLVSILQMARQKMSLKCKFTIAGKQNHGLLN